MVTTLNTDGGAYRFSSSSSLLFLFTIYDIDNVLHSKNSIKMALQIIIRYFLRYFPSIYELASLIWFKYLQSTWPYRPTWTTRSRSDRATWNWCHRIRVYANRTACWWVTYARHNHSAQWPANNKPSYNHILAGPLKCQALASFNEQKSPAILT